MIVTLTLNPSLDRTFDIDRLDRGKVNRVRSSTAEAAGKGVNVARALDANGFHSLAVLPLGGSTGDEMKRLLEVDGPPFVALEIADSTRANVTVIEVDGTVTKLNEPGAALTSSQVDEILRMATSRITEGDWLVASGSLPPGLGSDTYAGIVGKGHEVGALVAVDVSGPALSEVIEAGPDLIKPNLPELRELTGLEIHTLGEAIEAAGSIVAQGVGSVLASLGGDGAVLCSANATLYGRVAASEVVNTVGAGDTLLAGFLAGASAGKHGEHQLSEALTWARAAIRSPLTTMKSPTAEDRAAVSISRDIDVDAVLEDQ